MRGRGATGQQAESPGSPRQREEEIRRAIAELVRRHRRERGWTQEQLASTVGISFEHLNHIENCRATPSIDVLDRIAAAFGCRLSEFLANDESGLL